MKGGILRGLALALAFAACEDCRATGVEVVCAASDSPEALKAKATFVCPEGDARPVLQKAIDEADRLDVPCVLLRGTYVIDSRNEAQPRGGLRFFNPEPHRGKYYAHQKGRLRTFVGAIEPMGWYDGAVILMGERLYSSLGDDEEFSLLYCDGNDMFARGWEIGNLVIRLPDNRKPIAVVDGRFATALKYHGLWIGGFDPAEKDLALCTGMPVPHPGSVGVRGSAGSNIGVLNEWKRLTSMGFGTGFAIGGEHVYCESLAAVNNIYGFTFDCYKGKRSVSDPEPERACGGSYYPIVCVNLLDEHNVHMPRFGNASHWYGEERPADENQVQAITIRGMNIQWPNTCPGHTNRLDRDYLTGRHRATEAHPGCWRGTIEYVVDRTTPRNGVNMTDEPFFEKGHGLNVTCRNLHSPVRGTSARRQQMTPNPLQRYFDTDLKKELVFDGEAWRDAAGRAADGAKVDRAEFDVTLADYPRLAGETNDTERVCRAIAATVPGDVLYFPKGIYEISRTITATNGISLLLHKSATLKAVAKMENLLVIDRLSTWSQGGKEGITYDQGLFLRGGHLDGNGLATCLYLSQYFHFTVRDVVFANGYPYGLHVGKIGAELIANNLYFRTYLKGLAGNVALFSEGNDSYYTDIVVVDYTVGLRTTGGANAFTHYHVWGGFVPPVAKGRLPEMLENSICFDLGGYMNMLRDSYADTGAIGFRLGGWGQQVVGCWFLNNVAFGLKDITIVKQTPGSHDMLVADCCFRGSGPQTKLYEGPGTLKWRDMLYRGFGDGVELPAELETGPACTCATPDEWECVREPALFVSPAGEFKSANTARSLEVTVPGHAIRRRFPAVGPGREVVFRIRATDDATRKVEFSLSEENGRIWGKTVEIGPDWREVRLRLDELRYFSNWGLPPIPKGEKPDARRMTLARFMYGNWLTEGASEKAHGFEVSSLRILWGN